MPRQETRTLYTLAELKAQFPDAYKRVHERWVKSCHRNGPPWCDEVHDSYKAVVEACGGKIVGPAVRVQAHDEDDDGKRKDAAWLLREVLVPNGYVKDGEADFPGHCKWTGYCADDDMIESVWKAMKGGSTLTRALRALDDVIQKHNDDDMEQQESEESMDDNWNDNEYDKDGDEA